MELMCQFSEIAAGYGLSVDTYAEEMDTDNIGIKHACCIDRERLERLIGCKLNIGELCEKDKINLRAVNRRQVRSNHEKHNCTTQTADRSGISFDEGVGAKENRKEMEQ